MKRPALFAVLLAASLSPAAAETVIWPWKDKTPPDPALTMLTSIESVGVAVNKTNPPTVTVTVHATAPTPNFTELQLTPRIGDPKDLIFSFDAKGRPPQDMTIQVLSPVEINVEYSDAPMESLGVIEVYGQSNCKAFSVKDNKEVECTAKSLPTMEPTGTAESRQ
ncbi:MAG TPA: hypothetical protein VNJ31_07225 [Methyloceanibacter sp.]|nr:hypothetical protein [Methyloceanibacter sp.]